MSAQGAFKITEEFERLLCEYTGAPYAVAVDNCSNALFLALVRGGAEGRDIWIPRRTYPSVPCAIIHVGARVRWINDWAQPALNGEYLTGPYPLVGTPVWDCALRFTAGMYSHGRTQCLSFTGPYKHLKLGKGGAILTDSREDYEWYKRARFSGRNECSYLVDHFDMLGWNFYMLPEIAARGVALMAGFLRDGNPVHNPDLTFKFPDLSQFQIYEQASRANRANEKSRSDVGGRLMRDAIEILQGFGCAHVGAQSGVVTREEPIRADVPAQKEPYADYYAYRGNP